MTAMYIDGTVAFSNLTKHEVFNGTPTGKYSLVITLEDDAIDTLRKAGVKLREYEGSLQRKFTSQFPIRVVDCNKNPMMLNDDGEPVPVEVPRGSKVTLNYSYGKPHPVHGVGTYVKAVKVNELATPSYGEF